MLRANLRTLLLGTVFAGTQIYAMAANPTATLTVDAAKTGPQISPSLYGIFFEEINCAGDGGIYAELVRNRSFEDSDKPASWELEARGGKAVMSVEAASAPTEFNKRVLKLAVTDPGSSGIALVNPGYWGIAVKQGEAYEYSLKARVEDIKGSITLSLEGKDRSVYTQKKLNGLSSEWQTFKGSLKPDRTDSAARLVISVKEPGTVWLDMVSLFPKKTWKGRPNGLRSDLAGMLDGLKPAFVRFPGGCWVEGDTMALAYRWKQTVGDLANRRTQHNIWQYESTHGLGYHEYLQMCEDLRSDALFVVNCGMSHREVVPMDKMQEYVQDALDAVEYANGPATSQWGAVRAKNGHPAPFNLRYVEIGNENGGPAYAERYALIYHALKTKYPTLKFIANDWGGVPTSAPVEIIDEHYYNDPLFFLRNANRYDRYSRTGPKIYVGEYAVTLNCGAGNLRGALGEAAFMTGMERNSDVVVMASYAPLFANINYKKWNPDLINFDSSRVYGTPSYYVQKLFAENRGDVVLGSKLDSSTVTEPVKGGGIGLGTWETQAEYKDIKVTSNGKELYAWDPEKGLEGWRKLGGTWTVKDGAICQTAEGTDRRLLVGSPDWKDYTLSLKARKTGGVEGFLVLFNVQSDNTWVWLNLGGWGNTRHALEQGTEGGKTQFEGGVGGKIETGRWYDIRIEVAGAEARCFLDDKMVQKVDLSRSWQPLHAVASRSNKSGEIILKVVNFSSEAHDTTIELQGVNEVKPDAEVIVLTSARGEDENTIDQPLKVAPVTGTIHNAGRSFRHTLPANSLTVLRLKAN
jgi:alpha-L-arabinofuranosidase